MPITLTRTNSKNPDFLKLVAMLDAELDEMYGAEMDFYGQYNKVDKLNSCVIAYVDNQPAGCGAFKEYEPGVAEVKRMFVNKHLRGQGISAEILGELERWAKELKYNTLILETGDQQIAAMGLYKKKGFLLTGNYGQYLDAPNSICFAKSISFIQ